MHTLDEDDIIEGVSQAFQRAQHSKVNHYNNCAILGTLHLKAADIQKEVVKRNRERAYKKTGEAWFRDIFLKCLYKTFTRKKGDSLADNIATFVGAYAEFIDEKGLAQYLEERVDEEEDDDTPVPRTYSERFVDRVLAKLVEGFEAKDKVVRYRVLYVISKIVPIVNSHSPKLQSPRGQLSNQRYRELRSALIKRTNDRETTIRALAAGCLAVLSANETLAMIEDDAEDENADTRRSEEVVLGILHTEPTEVRKQIICNLTLNPETIPEIVKRTLDEDTTVRKLVYQTLAKGVLKIGAEGRVPGPSHPTNLRREDVESIIMNGLRDRDATPQTAATTLINEWVSAYENEFDDAHVLEKLKEEEEPAPAWQNMDEDKKSNEKAERTYSTKEIEAKRKTMGVCKLVDEVFDVSKRNSEQLEVVKVFLFRFFVTNPDIAEHIEFTSIFWKNLNLPTVLFSRVLIEWCEETKKYARLADLSPTLGGMTECVETHYDGFLEYLQDRDDGVKVEDAESVIEDYEFLLGELLKILACLDYGDVVGTRELEPLIRRMLTERRIPQHLLPKCLEIFKAIIGNERQFIHEVFEIIKCLKATFVSELSYEDMPQEEKDESDHLDIWCLALCIDSLSQVDGPLGGRLKWEFQDVFALIVNPNLKKESRDDIAVAATSCFSMSALVVPSMAIDVLDLALSELEGEVENQKMKLLLVQTAFDIIMRYPQVKKADDSYWISRPEKKLTAADVHRRLLGILLNEADLTVVSVLCEGFMKLFYCELIYDLHMLVTMFKGYLNPLCKGEPRLLQMLSTSFGAFAQTTQIGQKFTQWVFTDVYRDFCKTPVDQRVFTAAKLCALFEEWTDPSRLRAALEAESPNQQVEVYESIQLDLAFDIVKEMFEKDGHEYSKEDKKQLYQMLTRLYLPDNADEVNLMKLKLLIDKLNQYRPPGEGPSITAWKKFVSAFAKKYAAELEAMSEEDWKKAEEQDKFFKKVDDIIPMDSQDDMKTEQEEEEEVEPRPRGQKRRSLASAASTDVEDASVSGPSRAQSKRPRLSLDPEDDDPSLSYPTPPAKEEPIEPDLRPSRSSRSSKSGPPPGVPVYVISSDDEESPSPPPPPPPLPRRRRNSPPRELGTAADSAIVIDDSEDEAQIDADISYELRPFSARNTTTTTTSSANYTTQDSIFSNDDDDDDDSEAEVSGQLLSLAASVNRVSLGT